MAEIAGLPGLPSSQFGRVRRLGQVKQVCCSCYVSEVWTASNNFGDCLEQKAGLLKCGTC